jgi:hypothetical protein
VVVVHKEEHCGQQPARQGPSLAGWWMGLSGASHHHGVVSVAYIVTNTVQQQCHYSTNSGAALMFANRPTLLAECCVGPPN